MSGADPDLGAEREIDLARWRQALVRRWWIVAGGLLAGIIVGAVVSLSGGSVYQASVLLAPGQAFSPNGAPILNYYSSPRGISELVGSERALKEAARAAGIGVGALRGHVSTQSISTGAGTAASRGATLIKITAQLHKQKNAEAAADALRAYVIRETKSPYVEKSVDVVRKAIAGYESQLEALERRIVVLNAAIPTTTDPLTRIILVGQADQAALRQATFSNNLATAQQQLALVESIQYAQPIGGSAVAVKTTARSRRNSILVGALIGLILGSITAIVADPRLPRSRTS